MEDVATSEAGERGEDMSTDDATTSIPYGVDDAEAALDRLEAAGYAVFRNGRVLTPRGHETTPGEQADFSIVRSVYRYSRLV